LNGVWALLEHETEENGNAESKTREWVRAPVDTQ